MTHFLAFAFGPLEIGVVGVVAVLLFGNRLPKIARGLGGSLVEFKKGLREGTGEVEEARDEFVKAAKEVDQAIRD